MKGVTPVISLIMLMLVTVGIVGVSYTWFSGLVTVNTEDVLIIPPGGVQCYNNRISVAARNAGTTSNITDDDIVVADINGAGVRNTLLFGNFNTNGLAGYWRFEGDAKDYSGYGNTGNVNGATYTPNGWLGSALLFDSTDSVTGNLGSNTITTAGSVSAWVTVNNPSQTDQSIAAVRSGGNWFGVASYYNNIAGEIYGSSDGATCGSATVGCSAQPGQTCSVAPFAGKHVHVAMTFDNAVNLVKYYVNGVYVGSRTWHSCDIGVSQTFQIGGNLGVYFNGIIDEVLIWNRVLSADEVVQLNKTNSGNFTLGPEQGISLIKNYPVFSKGRHTVRIGTRNNIAEATIDCL